MPDPLTSSSARQILLLALGQPIGLLLATSDPERARQKLYASRAASGEAALAGLQIRISPFAEGQLVIVNQKILPTPSAKLDEMEGL